MAKQKQPIQMGMRMKSKLNNRWIWLILWTCVAGIWIADIVALFIVRPAFLSTWLAALAYAWVPFSLVYIAQLVVTGRKVPFRV